MSDIYDIPIELFYYVILPSLTFIDLAKFRISSKYFRNIVDHSKFYIKLKQKDHPLYNKTDKICLFDFKLAKNISLVNLLCYNDILLSSCKVGSLQLFNDLIGGKWFYQDTFNELLHYTYRFGHFHFIPFIINNYFPNDTKLFQNVYFWTAISKELILNFNNTLNYYIDQFVVKIYNKSDMMLIIDYIFIMCCFYGNLDFLKYLIYRLDYIKRIHIYLITGFSIACRIGYIHIAKFLLTDNYIPINSSLDIQLKLFHKICINGHIELIKFFDQNIVHHKSLCTDDFLLDIIKRHHYFVAKYLFIIYPHLSCKIIIKQKNK